MATKEYYNAVKDREKLEKENDCFIHEMLVISERSCGKTYSPLYDAFEQWIKTDGKHQAAYVRRWDSDFEGATSARSVYGSLMNNAYHENVISKLSKGMYDIVEYRGGAYYVGKVDEETGRVNWNRRCPIAYGFALNLWERSKGGGEFGNIKTIIFDEFLTTGQYIKSEFSFLMNLVSTIVRDRKDAHVYMMANTISVLGYPCWEDWGLQDEVVNLQKGDAKVYHYKDVDPETGEEKETNVALVWLDMKGKRGKSSEGSSYFAFGTAATRMITQGSLDIPSYPHIPDGVNIRPMDIVFECFLSFKKQLFHINLCDIDGNRFTFVHKKTTPIQDLNDDIIYSDDIHDSWRDNYSYGFNQKTDKIFLRIRDWLTTRPIYFDTNMTGYCFYTYIDQTKDITGKH